MFWFIMTKRRYTTKTEPATSITFQNFRFSTERIHAEMEVPKPFLSSPAQVFDFIVFCFAICWLFCWNKLILIYISLWQPEIYVIFDVVAYKWQQRKTYVFRKVLTITGAVGLTCNWSYFKIHYVAENSLANLYCTDHTIPSVRLVARHILLFMFSFAVS